MSNPKSTLKTLEACFVAQIDCQDLTEFAYYLNYFLFSDQDGTHAHRELEHEQKIIDNMRFTIF